MKFLTGLLIGILFGATTSASGQWAYVGAYTTQDLAKAAPAYAATYAVGVYDGLVATQYHIMGGGAGQAYLNQVWPCLRARVYDKNLAQWIHRLLASQSGRNAALTIIDNACGR